MYLLTVSPCANGIPYEELSYFSKVTVSPGDLVEITIRKRVCKALVLSVVDATDEKQSLKNASFVTKKISKVLIKGFINQGLWDALSRASSCMLRNVGTIIYDLISEKSFDELVPLSTPDAPRGFELLLLEQGYAHRMLHFKTTIREMFSKKRSLVIFFSDNN